MRIDRSLKFLTIMLGVAACSAPADSAPPAAAAPAAAAPVAADPAPAAAAAPNVVVNLHWDSAPLDREYRAARIELEARHAREISAPRPGETIVIRDRRQASENKALEARYERGKRDHLRSLPPN